MEFYPFYYIMRVPFHIVTNTFYRKIQFQNKPVIHNNVPVIIAMNHPNSFMDPIVFAANVGPKMFFLARGDAFKKGIVSAALEGVGIIPIYRLIDSGREGVQKNDETFRTVTKHLQKNHNVIIFAEGFCIQERRLRNLKKGCARMAFNAMEELQNEEILVIPVGVNYQTNPSYFRGRVFYKIGTPIKVKDYFQSYLSNKAKGVNHLTEIIQEGMKETVVHISHPENDTLAGELEEIFIDEFLEESNKNSNDLELRHELSLKIVKAINDMAFDAPEKLNALKEKSKSYFQKLKELKIRDKLVRKEFSGMSGLSSLLARTILFVAGIPLWIVGLLTNYLPYYLSEKIAKKLLKDIEWYASVALLIGMFAFLFWYLAIFLTAWFVFHDWKIFGGAVALTVLSGWFSLHYSPFRKKLFGSWRLYSFRKNKTAFENLQSHRTEIVNEIKSIIK